MLPKSSLEFLEELLNTNGPSGFEVETAVVYRRYLAGFAHEVRTDVLGNTIGVLNPKDSYKVMLAGHYDEIGFQVVNINDDGLVYFRTVGGVDKVTVPGTEVVILSGGEKIPGVIGKKPIHLVESKDRDKPPEFKDLWVDIGAESKKEAEKTVTIGDPIAVKPNFKLLGRRRIMSKGLDDKIGAFVVAEALRLLSKRKPAVGVYCVGTVQEELGLRGAHSSTFGIDPAVGFAVDVGFATDIPDVSKNEHGVVKLGKGPALTRNADNNEALGGRLRRFARKRKIAYQEKTGFRASGGTDTAAMQISRSGVATALVSIPNRYMHTQVEVCDLRDVEGAIKLLAEFIATIKPGDTFIPGID